MDCKAQAIAEVWFHWWCWWTCLGKACKTRWTHATWGFQCAVQQHHWLDCRTQHTDWPFESFSGTIPQKCSSHYTTKDHQGSVDALPSSVTAVTVKVVLRIDSFAKPAILNSCLWGDIDNPFGKLGWILHSASAEHLMVAGNDPFATCIVISVYSSPLESVIVIVGCDWVMTSKQNNRRKCKIYPRRL